MRASTLDLAVLTRLFERVGPSPIEQVVSETPTGRYARRIWFLYEWLLDESLSLDDASRGQYVDAVDTELQYGAEGVKSSRHRVHDNLPGSRAFCPLVFRTTWHSDLSTSIRSRTGTAASIGI